MNIEDFKKLSYEEKREALLKGAISPEGVRASLSYDERCELCEKIYSDSESYTNMKYNNILMSLAGDDIAIVPRDVETFLD